MLESFNTDGNAIFFGSRGFIIITDTGSHAGPFSAIYFLTDTVFTVLGAPGSMDPNSADITTVTFKAGTQLFNANGFTTLTLTSGSVIAYKG